MAELGRGRTLLSDSRRRDRGSQVARAGLESLNQSSCLHLPRPRVTLVCGWEVPGMKPEPALCQQSYTSSQIPASATAVTYSEHFLSAGALTSDLRTASRRSSTGMVEACYLSWLSNIPASGPPQEDCLHMTGLKKTLSFPPRHTHFPQAHTCLPLQHLRPGQAGIQLGTWLPTSWNK